MKETMNTMNKFFTSIEAATGGMIGILLSFVAPLAPFFWLAVGLVIADTITGIIAAQKRGDKITSKGFGRVMSKIIVYMMAILACYGVEVVLSIGGNVTYVAVGAIAFTELLSILENTRVVTGANVADAVRRLLPRQKKEFDTRYQQDEKEKNEEQ